MVINNNNNPYCINEILNFSLDKPNKIEIVFNASPNKICEKIKDRKKANICEIRIQ